MKKVIRLTEGDLHRIIKESVKRILREDAYDMPGGTWDGRAYRYDQALKNAESIEDWDRMMAERDKAAEESGEVALNYHPQRVRKSGGNSIGSTEYVHPERYGRTKDNVLDGFERDVKSEKMYRGFPS